MSRSKKLSPDAFHVLVHNRQANDPNGVFSSRVYDNLIADELCNSSTETLFYWHRIVLFCCGS